MPNYALLMSDLCECFAVFHRNGTFANMEQVKTQWEESIAPKGLLFPVEIEDYYNGACSLVPGFVNITSAIGICRVLNNITERR